MNQTWTEEKIAALIDGSLDDPDEAAALRRVLETDPDARALAERLQASNALLQEAFEHPDGAATPAAIQAAIFGEPGKVAAFPKQRRLARWIPAAAAACVAFAVGLGAGGVFNTPEPAVIAVLGDAPINGPLHAALESLPSGDISERGVQPMLSFWDGAGRPCREFEVIHELPEELEFGIACRGDSALWHVEILVSAPVTEPNEAGYAPASGPGGSALDAMLDALGAGPALTPESEAELLRNQWSGEAPSG